MQKTPSELLWRPTPREGKVLVGDEEAAEDEMAEISALEVHSEHFLTNDPANKDRASSAFHRLQASRV